jgi:hypothetical protein
MASRSSVTDSRSPQAFSSGGHCCRVHTKPVSDRVTPFATGVSATNRVPRQSCRCFGLSPFACLSHRRNPPANSACVETGTCLAHRPVSTDASECRIVFCFFGATAMASASDAPTGGDRWEIGGSFASVLSLPFSRRHPHRRWVRRSGLAAGPRPLRRHGLSRVRLGGIPTCKELGGL